MATIRQSVSTYAITISTFQQHRHFQVTAHANLFIATLLHYRDQGQFLLHAFVVMPDHVHVLITPTQSVSTAKAVQFIKGGYAHAVRELSNSEVCNKGYTSITCATYTTSSRNDSTSLIIPRSADTKRIRMSTMHIQIVWMTRPTI